MQSRFIPVILALCATLACLTAAGQDETQQPAATPPPAAEGRAPAQEPPAAKAEKPVPSSSAKAPQAEFRGWLVTTPDASWQQHWGISSPTAPDFKQVSSARRGDHIYTLIFMSNPSLNATEEVDVRCDLRVTAPNGVRAVQSTDLDCLHGKLNGDLGNVWLSHHVLEFVGEPQDPIGTWRVDVTLHDMPSNKSVNLHTTFELLEGT